MASKIENAEQLDYSKADSNDVDHSENATQLARKSSAGALTQGQPQERTMSSSDAHAAHGAPSFQRATPEELDHPASPRITHERNHDSEGSRGHYAKLVAPDVSSEKEIARLEHGRLVELERKLSAMLAAQTERDRRIAQLTDELARLKQSEANAVEAKKRAGLEIRELQAKLDKLVLSRDHAPEQAQSALQNATSHAAEANKRSQRELAELHAELEARKSELAAVHLRLTDVENGLAKSKASER